MIIFHLIGARARSVVDLLYLFSAAHHVYHIHLCDDVFSFFFFSFHKKIDTCHIYVNYSEVNDDIFTFLSIGPHMSIHICSDIHIFSPVYSIIRFQQFHKSQSFLVRLSLAAVYAPVLRDPLIYILNIHHSVL